MEEVIFIDLDGNIIQYNEICSHVGLASKIISENEELKKEFIKSSNESPNMFLINDIGYISVSVDPIYGIFLVANINKLSDIQREILMNYGKSGAKITLINQENNKDFSYGRHI